MMTVIFDGSQNQDLSEQSAISTQFDDSAVVISLSIDTVPPPPPPPPPPVPKVERISTYIEQMPRFPGCEDVEDEREGKWCSEKKLLAFINEHLRYPDAFVENCVQGAAVVTFVVETTGQLSDIRLLRDPGAGTGEEALRVVRLMPRWQPGKVDGRTARVQYTIPIRFRWD